MGELRRLTADIPAPAARASLPSNELRRSGPPLVRRALSLSVLLLTAAIACVANGAAARSIAVVALAVLAWSAAAIRRG
jgi:hypothetical protein